MRATQGAVPAKDASDEELLARFSRGDADAFALLVEKYQRAVYNFVLRSVRDRSRAEDLLQDTFLRVIQGAGAFKGESKFSTWLFTIARNLCIDSTRKMSFRRHRSLDAPAGHGDADAPPLIDRVPAGTPGADRDATSGRLGREIAQAVQALPDEQKEVFLLREVSNLPFKDIADIVGIPENTVKSRMRYALERLQRALAEYEDYAQCLR